jgi:protein-S-isoprenylcysteine O-methyltransferase Ste14
VARVERGVHDLAMSRIPALGPRGEGWVALQTAAIFLVVVGSRFGPTLPISDPGVLSVLGSVGSLFLGIGLAFLAAGIYTLARAGAFTVFPRPAATGQLVETGVFRVVRHPVYSGLIFASLGSALTQLSVIALIGAALLFPILDLKRRREEAWLTERYPGYAAYRARTKALIPRLY